MRNIKKEKIKECVSECIDDKAVDLEARLDSAYKDLNTLKKEFISILELKNNFNKIIKEIQTIITKGFVIKEDSSLSNPYNSLFNEDFIYEVNSIEKMINHETHNRYDTIVPVVGNMLSGYVGSAREISSCVELYTDNKWLLVSAIRIDEVKGMGQYYISISGKTPYFFFISEGDTFIFFTKRVLCKNDKKIKICMDYYGTTREYDIDLDNNEAYIKFSLLGAVYYLF